MRIAAIMLVLALFGCAKSDLDKHRDATQRVIDQRGAPDFVDASTNEYAAIQHSPSGMICVLPSDGAFEFDVFPAATVNAGAQCSRSDGEYVEAWVVVSFNVATTIDVAFAQAGAQLNDGLQSQAWSGQPSAADLASPEGLPHYRIGRYAAAFGEDRRYLRLSMAEADGWYLQQIVSAPLGQADLAEAQSGESWRRGLRAFADARARLAAVNDGDRTQ